MDTIVRECWDRTKLRTRFWSCQGSPFRTAVSTPARDSGEADAEAEGTSGRAAIEALRGYVSPRLDQMDYPSYRRRGLGIGSGAVESGRKQLAVQRAKGPGMHWIAEGLQAVLTLRAISLNGEWEAFWNTNPQWAPHDKSRC